MTEAARHAPIGRRGFRTTVLLPVIAFAAAAVCGLILLAIGTAQVGVTALLVGLSTALILLGPVLTAFLWLDRWEPEPTKLLVAAFTWGAGIAALAALLVNGSVSAVAELLMGERGGDVVAAVASAPLVEEVLKGAFVLAVLLLRRREFDGVIDGIIYAGVTAAGFAFTENIFYFAMAFDAGGIGDHQGSGVVATFMVRGVLSPFVHPLFTALTGIGIGLAAATSNRTLRIVAPLLGLLAAIGLHALWNFSAALGGEGFLNFYFLVMVPVFAGMLWLITWQRKREQHVITRQLPRMTSEGLIAPSEEDLLASGKGRRYWRSQVRARSGRDAARAVHRYQSAVSELAFLRHALHRGTARPDVRARQHAVLGELTEARAAAVRGSGQRSPVAARQARPASSGRT